MFMMAWLSLFVIRRAFSSMFTGDFWDIIIGTLYIVPALILLLFSLIAIGLM